MSSIFYLPDLGEGLPDAEICQWYVKEGDVVKADDLLVSMETAKAVVDVPAPQAGKISKLHGKPGDIIKTGAPLVEFTLEDTTSPKSEKPLTVDSHAKDAGTVVGNMEITDEILVESAVGLDIQHSHQNTIKALPIVRAIAQALDLPLSQLSASGTQGEITLEDLKKHITRTSSQSSISQNVPIKQVLENKIEPLRGVRRAMAQAMAISHQEVVPVTLMDDANIHAWSSNTDITARILRAIVYACHVEPALNAHFDSSENQITRHKNVHIGIAMDSKDGLFVPVMHHAENLSAKDMRTIVERFKAQVRERNIPQDDLKGSTIQFSNFGTFAGRYANPILVPPIVAILGTGKIREEVAAQNGAISIQKILPLSLTIDHRAVTGGEAARFLAALIYDLQRDE